MNGVDPWAFMQDLAGRIDGMHKRAARARALDGDACYRLYPEFLNPGLRKSIRVEARMRQLRVA